MFVAASVSRRDACGGLFRAFSLAFIIEITSSEASKSSTKLEIRITDAYYITIPRVKEDIQFHENESANNMPPRRLPNAFVLCTIRPLAVCRRTELI